MSSVVPLRKKQDQGLGASIDDLPENALQSILDCMDLRDAVRTSILSKQWRNKWKSLSQVKLDSQLFRSIPPQKFYGPPHNGFNYYMKIVDTVLSSQKNPILELRIYIPCWVLKFHPEKVSHWIVVAAKSGVKDLSLEQEYSLRKHLNVPACLFSCLELTHLSLCHFTMNPPLSFKGFPHLVRLKLDLEKPNLDKLEALGLISACPELRILHLSISEFYPKSSSPVVLCISAPKLESFVFYGFLPRCIHLKFGGATRNIRTASIGCQSPNHEGMGRTPYMVDFFTGLPNIEMLDLNFDFWEVLSFSINIPKKLPSSLSRLKSLKLTGIRYDCVDWNQFLVALCLLRSSPNLQQLDIFVRSYHDPWSDFVEDCSFEHLRTVNVLYTTGSSMDLQVIKFLLACSPVLEVMSIKLPGQMKEMDEYEWHQVAKLKDEIAQLHCASPKVTICML